LDFILKKINDIDWFAIEVVVNWSDMTYGNAENISIYLKDLFSGNIDLAMEATHNLWCSLSHQHSYITSAALPAYDFLIIGLDELDDKVKVEILDIIMGLALCTCDESYESSKIEPQSWEIELKQKLMSDIQKFKDLSLNADEDISYFAERIVSYLT